MTAHKLNTSASGHPRAGIFRYARSPYAEPSWRDALAALARSLTGPRADEGLLIARAHYDELGGYESGRSEARLLRQLGSAKAQLRSRLVRVFTIAQGARLCH